MMKIRHATMNDLEVLTAIETTCFPPSQAATEGTLAKRIATFGNHFWLLENDDGEVVSYIGGCVSDARDLEDTMYEDESLHSEDGKWQMLFSVTTLPKYEHHGYASILMKAVLNDCLKEQREGVVLTCLEDKISFYERFGFVNEGVSSSVHGHVVWYQMRQVF